MLKVVSLLVLFLMSLVLGVVVTRSRAVKEHHTRGGPESEVDESIKADEKVLQHCISAARRYAEVYLEELVQNQHGTFRQEDIPSIVEANMAVFVNVYETAYRPFKESLNAVGEALTAEYDALSTKQFYERREREVERFTPNSLHWPVEVTIEGKHEVMVIDLREWEDIFERSRFGVTPRSFLKEHLWERFAVDSSTDSKAQQTGG